MSPNLSESTPLDLDRKPPAWYSVITAHRTILRQRSPPAAWPGWLPWPRPWARWCALQMLLRCSRWTSSLNPGRRKPGLALKRVGGNQNIFGPRSHHCLASSVSQSFTHSVWICFAQGLSKLWHGFVKVVAVIYWTQWSMICRPKMIVWSGAIFIEGVKLLPGGDFKLVIVRKGRLWPRSQEQ